MIDVKQKVKIICANRNMTQKELAKIHGDDYQIWCNKMHRNTMRLSEVERIMDELDCDIVFVDRKTKKVY